MTDPTSILPDAEKAARFMDWQQVVANGGPPCFHLENDGRFCGRAMRWGGHSDIKAEFPYHRFISLEQLLRLHIRAFCDEVDRRASETIETHYKVMRELRRELGI